MVDNNDIDTRLWDYYFATTYNYDEFQEKSTVQEMTDDTKDEEPNSDVFRYT